MHVTICIPVFNGGQRLVDVVTSCRDQFLDDGLCKLLIVDSGSTDGAVDRIPPSASYPLEVIQIPNAEFGHGRTRNLLAERASGDLIVFLTQDAQPIGPEWLRSLKAPFADPMVDAVFGKQIARSESSPMVRREIDSAFETLERLPFRRTGSVEGGGWTAGFFSNCNSAIRATTLRQIPFRDVEYAEDQRFARDLLDSGGTIEYCPRARVEHSHDYSPLENLRRSFDETRGLYRALGKEPRTGLALVVLAIRDTARDLRIIWTDHCVAWPERLYWSMRAPLHNGGRRLAVQLAMWERLPMQIADWLSLEARTRSGSRDWPESRSKTNDST